MIKPRPDRAAVRAAVGPADRYDLVIFVSANAVRFGADMLDQRRDLKVAAVGQATAAALNAAGYRVSLMPSEGADSEALLAMPQLAHMAGQRVLIVRGTGGRELLSEVLTARGAQVQYAEVYTREAGLPLAGTARRKSRRSGARAASRPMRRPASSCSRRSSAS